MLLDFNFVVFIYFIYVHVLSRTLIYFIKDESLSFINEVINFELYMSIVTIIAATLFPIGFNQSFLTLLVEFTQGFILYRFCEIDDLWLNALDGFGELSYIRSI